MEWLQQLFGKSEQINSWQMCARGIIVFLAALIILRIGSKKTFGKESAIDNLVVIMLGGMLSRVVTGAAPFVPVMSATFAIILLHRLLAFFCMRYSSIDKIIKGDKKLLFSNEKFDEANMKKTLVSKDDIMEGIRLMANEGDTDCVKNVYIETCGQISVVKKKRNTS